MSLTCKKVLFFSLAVLIFAQSVMVECKPKRKSGSKKIGSALAGGLAGFAVGTLLNKKPVKNHYHYQNPPAYAVPVVVQPPVVYAQPQPVVYQQQPVVYQQPAVVYQQQPVAAAPVAPAPVVAAPVAPAPVPAPAPVVPAPVAPAPAPAVVSYSGKPTPSPIANATNQTNPISPLIPVTYHTDNGTSTITATNASQIIYSPLPVNNSVPIVVNATAPVAAVPVAVAPAPAPVVAAPAPVVAAPVPVAPVPAPVVTAPVVTQQYIPVPVQVAPAQVFTLSKTTGHYGRNSADNHLSLSYLALLLLPVLMYFI